ncbi:hypothetical protein BDW59DRAFT_142030 [Aspergillus cavernicola]|uniref:Secreted protein n=1 Tax=Aspergillus cavernicola TaxID=176166 RepID=A0ABR4IPY7_9EURO
MKHRRTGVVFFPIVQHLIAQHYVSGISVQVSPLGSISLAKCLVNSKQESWLPKRRQYSLGMRINRSRPSKRAMRIFRGSGL